MGKATSMEEVYESQARRIAELEQRIAELEAINAELEKASSYSLLKQNEKLKAENAEHHQRREIMQLCIQTRDATIARMREALKNAIRPTEIGAEYGAEGYERYRHWWHHTRSKALQQSGEYRWLPPQQLRRRGE